MTALLCHHGQSHCHRKAHAELPGSQATLLGTASSRLPGDVMNMAATPAQAACVFVQPSPEYGGAPPPGMGVHNCGAVGGAQSRFEAGPRAESGNR